MFKSEHIPVFLAEIHKLLLRHNCKTILDMTFGGGGYSRLFLGSRYKIYYDHLETLADSQVFAIDRDPDTLKRAECFRKVYQKRFSFRGAKFSELDNVYRDTKFDAAIFDLGASTDQVSIDFPPLIDHFPHHI